MTHPNEPRSDPVRGPPQPDEPRQEENRDFANIVALVFVIALAVGAFWLFEEIQRHNEILNCVALAGVIATLSSIPTHPSVKPPS